jgi:gliding motility-associated-like protein
MLGAALLLGWATATAQVAMPDTVCIGTTRQYQVNDPSVPSTYTWALNGVVQPTVTNAISFTWNTPGVYTLTVQERSANGCLGDLRSGLVHVLAPPVPNAGPDRTICFGGTAQLGGSGGTSYSWSPPTGLSNPNIPNPVVNIATPGTYEYVLTVTNANGCAAVLRDTVKVTILPQLRLFAGNDTLVALNQPLQLNATDPANSGFVNYLWSPPVGLNNSGIKNPVALYTSLPGSNGITYTVVGITANGCTASDDINIKVFAQAGVFVPNAFTPNGDGLNDVVRPILVGIRELKYFSVFNRYGEMVYTTSVQGAGWDGTFKGSRQNQGAYVWQLQAVDLTGNVIMRKGSVILIR